MKKNIQYIFSVLFVLVVFFSSCTKKSDDPAPNIPASNTTTTSPSAISTMNPADGSYFPLTKNNTWSYSSEGDGNYTSIVTGDTKVIDGKTYKQLENTYEEDGTSDYYYVCQEGNKYYSYTDTMEAPFKMKVIDLDLPIGTPWYASYSRTPYATVVFTMKVTGTGLTRSVNGIQYTNVVSVHLKTQVILTNEYINFLKAFGYTDLAIQALYASNNATEVYYYARNIGLIEITASTKDGVQLLSSTIY